MTIKFTDCALKVMDVLWEMGEGNALDLVTALMKRDCLKMNVNKHII